MPTVNQELCMHGMATFNGGLYSLILR